jgi:hypothetical protein
LSVTLAATYHPRGETGRLQRLYPQLRAVYDSIVLSLPPEAQDVDILKTLSNTQVHVNEEWSQGRYKSLELALETECDYVHYADMDRLLRWLETRPDEWRRTVDIVQQHDCLVIGRTEQAWATHPKALRETERIFSSVFSRWLGQELDFGAGSKGFSRAATAFLVANGLRGRALGADSEWIVLLHRAGFAIESVLVDGLDWESADRYQDVVADAESQQQAAAAYDADSANWAWRVAVAQEIVDAGLDAMQRELVSELPKRSERREE